MEPLHENSPSSTSNQAQSLSTGKSPRITKKIGRPSLYSEKVVETICRCLSEGKTLGSICEMDGMPSKSVVMAWLWDGKHKEFQDRYALAREQQAETLADEIVDISDENPISERYDKEGNSVGTMVDSAGINRNRLRVDARKWVAAKLLPKRYGEKADQVNVQVNTQVNSVPTLSPELESALTQWAESHTGITEAS